MFEIDDERAYITEIQRLLRRIGYNVKPDGIYGQETRNAVSNFQKSIGLPIRGRVDLDTYEALVAASSDMSIYEPVYISPLGLTVVLSQRERSVMWLLSFRRCFVSLR